MKYRNDPEGLRLPVKLDATTNGEFAPVPLEAMYRHANRLALEEATARSRRLGMDRRSFLISACGVTSTLASFNTAYAAAGRTGGFYEMRREAPLDLFAARSAVDGNEFVFDVQAGRHASAPDPWACESQPARRPRGHGRARIAPAHSVSNGIFRAGGAARAVI